MTKTEKDLLIFLLELFNEEISYMSCDEVEMDFSQDILDWLVENSDEGDGLTEENFMYDDKILVSMSYLINMLVKKLKVDNLVEVPIHDNWVWEHCEHGKSIYCRECKNYPCTCIKQMVADE